MPGYGEIKRCPKKLLTPETRRIMELYNHCHSVNEAGIQPNGILPMSGGLLDQSATLMEAFSILTETVMRIWSEKKK